MSAEHKPIDPTYFGIRSVHVGCWSERLANRVFNYVMFNFAETSATQQWLDSRSDITHTRNAQCAARAFASDGAANIGGRPSLKPDLAITARPKQGASTACVLFGSRNINIIERPQFDACDRPGGRIHAN